MRVALRLLQLGAIAVVVAVSTFHTFELDRFFVPKELVLHATALLAALFAFNALRRMTFTRVDLLLAVYLALSAISAALATNRWLGLRALAISASAVLLFWTARALRGAGIADALLNALALAVVLVAVTSLLQTYGIDIDLFSEQRAPGGTLGNRNFVAHAAAFGLPLVLLAALRGSFFSSIGVAAVTASLVLTRSRGAWLAFAVVAIVIVAAMLISPALRRDARTWRRFLLLALFAGGGVAAALLIPNTLKWRSDNPYLESVRRVADYREGSGRGRLVQYQRSLALAARHPLFGVGPGNWPVEYPARVPRSDPSLNESEPGTTFNPWPSSDWIAFICERGFAAAALLLIAFATIAIQGARQLVAARDTNDALLALTLLGTLAGAGVAGAFDAVLLIALPAFLVWSTLGATWAAPPTARNVPAFLILALIVVAALGVVRSTTQLIAMQLYPSAQAARFDPGNYRVQLRLARSGRRAQRCEHALAAHALFPSAEAGISAARGCD